MSPTPERSVPNAIAWLVLGIFMASMTWVVLDSYEPKPNELFFDILALVAVGGIMGITSAALLWASFRAMYPKAPNAASKGAPAILLCPACGSTSEGHCACGARFSPNAWKPKTQDDFGLGGALLFSGAGIAVTALGLLIGFGGYEEGRPIAAAVGFAALALLVTGVGMLIVYGALLMVREKLRGQHEVRMEISRRGPGIAFFAKAEVAFAKGIPLYGSGSAEEEIAFTLGSKTAEPSPMAIIVAFLASSSRAGLSTFRTLQWTLRNGARTATRNQGIRVRLEDAYGEPAPQAIEAAWPWLQSLFPENPMALADLEARCDERCRALAEELRSTVAHDSEKLRRFAGTLVLAHEPNWTFGVRLETLDDGAHLSEHSEERFLN